MGSIATSVVPNEVEKMERKDACKYSLKRSEILKLYQRKHQFNLGEAEGEAAFVSDLLFQRLAFLLNG